MQALETDETFQCASVDHMLSNDMHLKAMHLVVRIPETFAPKLKYTLVLKCRVLGKIRFMNENEMMPCFLFLMSG